MSERSREGSKLEVCLNLIKEFEAVNPKYKYKSDLDVFIRESKMEDFYAEKVETIFVSTIHKAKGREFDNVFLMLEQCCLGTDEAIRLLYVAMTRAKRNLTIHCHGNFLDFIKTENLERADDHEGYPPPSQLVMQLSHKDVFLDYFESRQFWISQLNSGDELIVDGDGCRSSNGQSVLMFSKQFANQIVSMGQKNYVIQKGRVRFIAYWKKENSAQEIKIVLPELCFCKIKDAAEVKVTTS